MKNILRIFLCTAFVSVTAMQPPPPQAPSSEIYQNVYALVNATLVMLKTSGDCQRFHTLPKLNPTQCVFFLSTLLMHIEGMHNLQLTNNVHKGQLTKALCDAIIHQEVICFMPFTDSQFQDRTLPYALRSQDLIDYLPKLWDKIRSADRKLIESQPQPSKRQRRSGPPLLIHEYNHHTRKTLQKIALPRI